MMGDKMAARNAMMAANVPVVPGTEKPVEEEQQAIDIAKAIGFPILIKAAAGGGGYLASDLGQWRSLFGTSHTSYAVLGRTITR